MLSQPIFHETLPLNRVFIEESPESRNVEWQLTPLFGNENCRLPVRVRISDFIEHVRIFWSDIRNDDLCVINLRNNVSDDETWSECLVGPDRSDFKLVLADRPNNVRVQLVVRRRELHSDECCRRLPFYRQITDRRVLPPPLPNTNLPGW